MRDLDLALSYVPRPQRFHLADLFALDAALGDVVRTTREPMVGRIRLAWWRERLQEIDQGIVPAEPRLEAIARVSAATSLSGAQLSTLADGWEPLLEPFPWGSVTIGGVAARGSSLFGLASLILGTGAAEVVKLVGSLWSLVDVAKHCSDAEARYLLVDVARSKGQELHGSVDAALRPLTMLGLLAKRDIERWPDVEPEGTPGRAWLMIRHKLTGHL